MPTLCYSGPFETLNIGACMAGSRPCVDGYLSSDCLGEILPQQEDFGTPFIDEDCNGLFSCNGGGSPSGASFVAKLDKPP